MWDGYVLVMIEVIAYQHKLTRHCLKETATSEDMSSVFATNYFWEKELENNLGEELDDKLEDKNKDDICRTRWRTIGRQA